ncbi:hypothetical protein [Sphingomonas sp. PP-CC-3A-396]|uniref:hypothetical protein n=1 Tax=Sphingomonas sp. PP-CC-3A-396 TaxID=2135655 RepID=UPI001050D91D|nr:hypothetical protein [Sphingomonas sp. PP-CC-3A-396]TCQ02863.1 hypothetical protein C8J40_11432 [Sphingomonas sp. PP-CC-3A-396]
MAAIVDLLWILVFRWNGLLASAPPCSVPRALATAISHYWKQETAICLSDVHRKTASCFVRMVLPISLPLPAPGSGTYGSSVSKHVTSRRLFTPMESCCFALIASASFGWGKLSR